ncbi:hypothetical protein D9M73_258330 [compost metagenome]
MPVQAHVVIKAVQQNQRRHRRSRQPHLADHLETGDVEASQPALRCCVTGWQVQAVKTLIGLGLRRQRLPRRQGGQAGT